MPLSWFWWRQPEQSDREQETLECVEPASGLAHAHIDPHVQIGGYNYSLDSTRPLFWSNPAEFGLLPAFLADQAPDSNNEGIVAKPETCAIQSSVWLNKSSIRFVQTEDVANAINARFRVVFEVDCNVACTASVLFLVRIKYEASRDAYDVRSDVSQDRIELPKGYGQSASTSVTWDFSQLADLYHEGSLEWYDSASKWPLAIIIHCPSLDGFAHSLVTLVSIKGMQEGQPRAVVLCQWLQAYGRLHAIHDLYDAGISEELPDEQVTEAVQIDDTMTCVACMSEPREVVVLPCRHLCLCHDCALVLRHRATSCPLCRESFHSLLRMRVARTVFAVTPASEDSLTLDNVRYKCVPLLSTEGTPRCTRAAEHGSAPNKDKIHQLSLGDDEFLDV